MVSNRTQLNELVGQNILACTPSLERDGWVRAKVHSVETAGIGIETQSVTDACLKFPCTPASDNVYALFIPFVHVLSIVCVADDVVLYESSLDL